MERTRDAVEAEVLSSHRCFVDGRRRWRIRAWVVANAERGVHSVRRAVGKGPHATLEADQFRERRMGNLGTAKRIFVGACCNAGGRRTLCRGRWGVSTGGGGRRKP